ncbi:MAG TPA: DUF559 domain-containing protein [Solimonas sp.]|nr:DUF559 domain-containing protein [Solimonas sp.]
MALAQAKVLRGSMTDAERKLWYLLRAHRLLSEKFRRQQPIGPYIVDFLHFGARVVIEVDGGQHADSVGDVRRDAWLRAQGFIVLRFWNDDVLLRTESVLEEILRFVTAPSPVVGVSRTDIESVLDSANDPPPRGGRGDKRSSLRQKNGLQTRAALTPLPPRGGGDGGEGAH